MAVLRINKTKDYTIMSNYHFKEKNMSLKAKGLLSEMLSLPDDWDYSIAGLVAINKENETSIKTALDELKDFRYLKVTKIMPDKTDSGRIEYVYDIFERPYQETEKQGVENLGVENQGQYNTNKLNTNNKSKKESKITFDELIDNYTNNEELRTELKNHLAVRKAKKGAMTNRAIELSLKNLDNLANNDEDKIKIVQASIMSGWVGFFKSDKKTTTLNKDYGQRKEIDYTSYYDT